MKVIKWLDEHFEETILIFLLVLISCVALVQVVARNVPFIPSLSWAEELNRFAWIATVFLSLPYTFRTSSTLRVTAVVDILPWKMCNVMGIIVDIFTAIMMAIMSYAGFAVLQRIIESGETSPAMLWPMWIMYLIVFIGFTLGGLRNIQMCVIHIKNINVPPVDTTEEQARMEIASELGTEEADAIGAAFTNTKRGGN